MEKGIDALFSDYVDRIREVELALVNGRFLEFSPSLSKLMRCQSAFGMRIRIELLVAADGRDTRSIR